MDKKEIVIQAEKFLTTNVLYGTISGIQIKDFLESRADSIVKDGWTVEDTAVKIDESLYNKETGEPLFTYAYERASLPLNSLDPNFTKKDYIDKFIKSIPYKGNIKTGPGKEEYLNIEEELKKLQDRLNDDNLLLFADKNISLKEYYKKLLDQEYTPTMRKDKIEVIMAAIRGLREIYPNYDELANKKINGKSFVDLLLELPDKMLDNFDVKDRLDIIPINDYLSNEFKKVSEYTYNSVNSKPISVEPIGIEYNEEHQLSVTNEYIFLSPDEENSLHESMRPRTIEEERKELHEMMLLIIDGMNKSNNLDTLSQYDGYFTKVIETIKTKFPEDNFLKELYTKMLEIYDKVSQEIKFIEDNDDIRYIVGQDLKDIKDEYTHNNVDYNRTLEDNPDNRRKTVAGLRVIKKNSYDMGIQGLHHEIDEIDKDIIKSNISRYGLNNTNHDKDRLLNEADIFMMNIKSESRALNNTIDARSIAALQISIDKNIRELNRLLNDALEKGLLTEEEKQEYDNVLNNSKGGKSI